MDTRGRHRRGSEAVRATELVSDPLLEKFCLVGSPETNAGRVTWLFDNGVYPIVYPLPRSERMVDDHH